MGASQIGEAPPPGHCSAGPGAGNCLRVSSRYFVMLAGTPLGRCQNTGLRSCFTLTPSPSRCSAEIFSTVGPDTSTPPLVADSITLAAVLTSTPSPKFPWLGAGCGVDLGFCDGVLTTPGRGGGRCRAVRRRAVAAGWGW